LPAGEAVLDAAARITEAGYTAAKWKIAVEAAALEWDLLRAIHDRLPPACELRLDANGALDEPTARAWLERLDALPRPCLLEQPLRPGYENTMRALDRSFKTPVALDESLAGFESLGSGSAARWPGILVVKPALGGDTRLWRAFRTRQTARPVIFSSVFESAFGMESVLRWIGREGFPQASDADAASHPALGFDTLRVLEDDGLTLHKPGPMISALRAPRNELERLWQQL
jgi:O-succinylbenzoate synthase